MGRQGKVMDEDEVGRGGMVSQNASEHRLLLPQLRCESPFKEQDAAEFGSTGRNGPQITRAS